MQWPWDKTDGHLPSLTEEEEMETDTRSSLGQSASETEEDTVSISKKEVWDGAGSGRNGRRRGLGPKITPIEVFSKP